MILITLISLFGCTTTPTPPDTPEEKLINHKEQLPHKRVLETRPYSAERPAIIFRLNNVMKGSHEKVVEEIIRKFAENKTPLNVCIVPFTNNTTSYNMPFLRNYLDAGVIDVSIQGYNLSDSQFDSTIPQNTYETILQRMLGARENFTTYYGTTPASCTFTYNIFDETSYTALQDAGFRIFSWNMANETHPSREPVNYEGNFSRNGMCRLPSIEDIAEWNASRKAWGNMRSLKPDSSLFNLLYDQLSEFGVGVLSLEPQTFIDEKGDLDSVKLEQLTVLIKASEQLGTVTTLEAWSKYADKWMFAAPYKRKKQVEPFTGGPAIIFRMDDVSKGWHEDILVHVLEIFKENGVPIDMGVLSYANGQRSFDIPLLREYLDAGIIDVSVHGYDWTSAQFDTDVSGTNYRELRFQLMKAREQYRYYFGEVPVTCTVPTNVFNEVGYRAIQNSGFEVFSTLYDSEPHPSTIPVDYFGKPAVNGMYRIPTASDIFYWDEKTEQWGSMYSIKYGGKWYTDVLNEQMYNNLFYWVNRELKKIDVAVISMHPSAFVDENNAFNPAYEEQLETIIEWTGTLGTRTTFSSWYKYLAQQES